MQKGQFLQKILRSPRTVFTAGDIASLWGDPPSGRFRVRLHYYVHSAELIRIRKGLYARDQEYDRLELATCLFRPSYVSYETVLWREGVILHETSGITVASYLSRQVDCGGRTIRLHKVRETLLKNTYGIELTRGYPIASLERAFLDTLRRSPDFRFDDVYPIDWEMVFRLLPLYQNQRLYRQVDSMHGGKF